MSILRCIVCGLVLIPAAHLSAKQDGLRPPVERGPLTIERLLSRPDVQHDLRLTNTQTARIASVFAALSDELAKFLPPPTPPGTGLTMAQTRAMSEKSMAASKRAEAEAIAILTKIQRQRLDQIRLQAKQARVLTEPNMQKTLGFSPSQTAAVEAIQKRWIDQMSGNRLPMPPRDDSFERAEEWTRVYSEQMQDGLMAVLTGLQQVRLRELLGHKFRGDSDLTSSYLRVSRNHGNSTPWEIKGYLHQIEQMPYLLLVRDDVLADLKLTPDQHAAILALVENPQYAFSRPLVPGALPASRDPRLKGLSPLPSLGLGKLLNDQQRIRLQEIRIQLLGERMLLDPDIQGALRLKDRQVQQIAEIHRSWELRSRIALRRLDSEEVAEYLQAKLRQEMMSALRKVLTPDEQTWFIELGGRKFETMKPEMS